jgi:hypothetical protein
MKIVPFPFVNLLDHQVCLIRCNLVVLTVPNNFYLVMLN